MKFKERTFIYQQGKNIALITVIILLAVSACQTAEIFFRDYTTTQYVNHIPSFRKHDYYSFNALTIIAVIVSAYILIRLLYRKPDSYKIFIYDHTIFTIKELKIGQITLICQQKQKPSQYYHYDMTIDKDKNQVRKIMKAYKHAKEQPKKTNTTLKTYVTNYNKAIDKYSLND